MPCYRAKFVFTVAFVSIVSFPTYVKVHIPLLDVSCYYFVSFVFRNFEFSSMSFYIDFSCRI
jgi:hypothetical protein